MNIKDVATPSYIVDEGRLKSNLEILKSVIDRTGCRILLAQKCFSMYAVYPLIGAIYKRLHRKRTVRGKAWI